MTPITKAWWKDTLERFVWTVIQGGLGILTLDALGWVDFGDLELWKAAAAGGAAAGLSFVKSVAAKRLSSGETAQLGVETYNYTASGPGAAGDLADA